MSLYHFISFSLIYQLHLMESIKTWTCVKLKWRLQLWWLGNLDYCSILLSKIAEKHCLEFKLVNFKSTNKQHFEANQGKKLLCSSNVYIQRLELSYHSFFCIPFFCPSLVIQCFCWMWILMLGILCNYFDLLLWTLQMDHYLLKQTTYKLYVWINLVINCLQLVMVVTTKSTIFARGLFI